MVNRKFGVLDSGTEVVSVGLFLFIFTRNSFGAISPIRNKKRKTGRNNPCPCGSNKKHKNCCISKNTH